MTPKQRATLIKALAKKLRLNSSFKGNWMEFQAESATIAVDHFMPLIEVVKVHNKRSNGDCCCQFCKALNNLFKEAWI